MEYLFTRQHELFRGNNDQCYYLTIGSSCNHTGMVCLEYLTFQFHKTRVVTMINYFSVQDLGQYYVSVISFTVTIRYM